MENSYTKLYDGKSNEEIVNHITIEACYDNGHTEDKDDPIDRGNYGSCERFRADNDGKNPYYEGFRDGCKSVEGNSEEICESATD